MPNLGQRYIAALSQLSQFHFVIGDKTTLTHVLSGVQVAPESADEDAENADLLRLTFGGGHTVLVAASYYLELMLSEDAAHRMHAVSEGSGEVHKRAKQLLEHLSWKHNLLD
ncbi:MAG: hypothetical protein EOO79_02590 [Oxalobacteraceae bacterium]|nr:MAG: hypothetical protein EOO79_02590 [Oxalobacteraceae bacterium]